nr:hypothetical protein GCM10020092_008040 [Actinoplanes digitatis]
MSVGFGALTFSLAITENWSRAGGTDAWPTSEVRPGSAWNYGLDGATSFAVTTGLGNTNDPFTPATAPIRITTPARKIPAWTADSDQIVTPLQDSPTPSAEPSRDRHADPDGRGPAADHVVPHDRRRTAVGAARRGVPDPEPAQRQGPRR